MRHLTLVNPDDLPRLQVALGTARLLVDIARAELDVTLAGTSEGFALLDALLAHDPQVKVIVLSGQSDRANALRAVDRGAYDFLAKPFDVELLNLTVERALRLHEAATVIDADFDGTLPTSYAPSS